LKLIIQIPAYNEEATIAATLADLPRKIDGIDTIETLVIDDGSSDGTIAAARKSGVTHIVRLLNHRGLATAFVAGINASLRLGADVIVNTDADNQYNGEDIARLVAPIVRGTSEVVIGDRDVRNSPYMGPVKKMLQRWGSWAVGLASGMSVPDVTSGLRAFSRDAAFEINVFNPFTYTLETIIQAGNRNLQVQSVIVRTNPPARASRLYRGAGSYVRKSVATIFRIYTLYKPLKTFFAIGGLFLLAGVALGIRFLFYLTRGEGGHVQSLILAAVFLIVGFQTLLIGLVADLISVNRRLSEELLIRMKKLDRQPSASRPSRRQETAERKSREPKPPTAAPESRPEPETQWVWLLDETKLEGREDETAVSAPTPAASTPANAATTSSSRRRRRRRSGVRPFPEHRPAHTRSQPTSEEE